MGTATPVAAAGLNELKHWLRIVRNDDDAQLSGQLRAAVAWCEQFTGGLLLERDVIEDLACRAGWMTLAPRPVVAILDVVEIVSGGTSVALAVGDYAIEIDPDGTGRVRIDRAAVARIRVTLSAGLTDRWDGLPEPIRQGIIRLAAHLYAERGVTAVVPSAVAAFWRPYRRLMP